MEEIYDAIEARERTTVDEAAKLHGLRVYDTALPQPWVDDVYDRTGVYPVGKVVWCYDEAKTFGAAFPLTREGAAMLARYRELTGHS